MSRCSSRCATARRRRARTPRRSPTADARAGHPSRRGSGSSSSTPRTAATSSRWSPAPPSTPTPGVIAHDDIIGATRAARSPGRPAGVPRAAAHPERHRPQDAPGGTGHLPQGSRGHPHRRRHRAGPAGPRGRGRVGRPVHDGAAGGRLGRGLRAPRGLRRTGQGQRARPRWDPTSPTGSRSATSPRASTRRDLDRSCSTCPSRTRWSRPPRTALRPGGILLAYLPTINQTALLRQALDDEGAPFGLAETQEVMRRTWHIEARSVRPDHRMVGHTGFLTTARRLHA